ncbi:MAG: hypothetical protein AseanaTS_17230 [Candidatus Pelagadaptatus aseana]|uniref:hypothetical protein n=1 Tax=Candidatus Pelagadaptatus aseana TaxID=3120508 RepID=UPI0039B159A0
MSSTLIISIIIAVLVLLMSYAFISQTITTRRQQKQRLLTALKIRARDFKFLINGFPPNFLSKDLSILVYRCIIEVTEQLAKLEPKEKLYVEELTLYNKQLEEVQRKPKNAKRAKLTNPQQTKEVKRLLQELNKFLAHLRKRGTINASQHANYEQQIKNMVVQLSVDSYIINAKQASGSGKTRLAIHYYTLARKLLAKESGKQNYQKQIQQLSGVIAQLEEKALAEEAAANPDRAAAEAQAEEQAATEWDEFNKGDESWKKKSVYD